MRIVRIRTTKPNSFWFFDNINLTPGEDTSPPFDFDKVYEEGRQFIERSVRVTGRIEIIDSQNTREQLITITPSKKPHYELPFQQHNFVSREILVSVPENNNNETVIASDEYYDVFESTSPVIEEIPEIKDIGAPIINSILDINPEDRKKANKLLTQKVNIIEKTINKLPSNQQTRRFLFACLESEHKRKNRKSICVLLEDKFLQIPPEGE
jgi:hypothetical protein